MIHFHSPLAWIQQKWLNSNVRVFLRPLFPCIPKVMCVSLCLHKCCVYDLRCVCRALAQSGPALNLSRKSCLFLSLYITNTLFIKRGVSSPGLEDGVCLWGGSQLSGCLWPSTSLFTESDCRGNSFCLSNLQIRPKTEQLPLRMGTGWHISSSLTFFVYSMSSSSDSLSYFCCSFPKHARWTFVV